MRIYATGIKAWLYILGFILIVLLVLYVLFQLFILLLPFILILIGAVWLYSYFKKRFKKEKKSYIDVEFKVK